MIEAECGVFGQRAVDDLEPGLLLTEMVQRYVLLVAGACQAITLLVQLLKRAYPLALSLVIIDHIMQNVLGGLFVSTAEAHDMRLA